MGSDEIVTRRRVGCQIGIRRRLLFGSRTSTFPAIFFLRTRMNSMSEMAFEMIGYRIRPAEWNGLGQSRKVYASLIMTGAQDGCSTAPNVVHQDSSHQGSDPNTPAILIYGR